MSAEIGLLIAAFIAIYYQQQNNRIQMLKIRTLFYFEMKEMLGNIKIFLINFEQYQDMEECNKAMSAIESYSSIFLQKKEEAKLIYGNNARINKVFEIMQGPIGYCTMNNDRDLQESITEIRGLGGYNECIVPKINAFEKLLLEETMVEPFFSKLKRICYKIICY